MSKLRAVLRRRWPILIVTLLLGAAAGYFSAGRVGPERQTTQYQASQVVVANRLAGNPANVSQDALKVTRGEVPVVAAATLGDPDSAGLARKVRVSDDIDSRSISLTVTDPDSQRASEIVQAFTAAFLEVVNAELRSDDQRQLEQLNERVEEAAVLLALFDQENAFIVRPDVPLPQTPTVDALVAERTRLVNELQDAQNRLAEAELEISQREPYSTLGAEAPRVADSQRLAVPESPVFRATLLGLLGLFLGAGLVLLVERVNRRVDTREELAELIDVPILAEIGRIPNRRLPADGEGHVHLDGAWSEQYRRVRSAIEFVQTQAERSASANGATNGVNGSAGNGAQTTESHHGRVIAGHGTSSGVPRRFMFVSALPEEGKSTSVALTALALAEAGDEVVAVNADFRRPKLDRYLNSESTPSLADLAEMSVERPSLDDVVRHGQVPHLWTVSAGPPTTEVSGRLAAVREVVVSAAGVGATVLVDSSPLRVSNDPIDMLPLADEVILVVRSGRNRVKVIQDTMELLDMHYAPVMGVILIGTSVNRESDGYYASYYVEPETKPKPKPKAKRRRSGTPAHSG